MSPLRPKSRSTKKGTSARDLSSRAKQLLEDEMNLRQTLSDLCDTKDKLGERHKALDSLEETLAKEREQLRHDRATWATDQEEWRQSCAKKEARLRTLVANAEKVSSTLKEKEEAVAQRMANVDKKEAELAGRLVEVAKWDATVKQKEADIAKKEADVAKKSRDVEEQLRVARVAVEKSAGLRKQSPQQIPDVVMQMTQELETKLTSESSTSNMKWEADLKKKEVNLALLADKLVTQDDIFQKERKAWRAVREDIQNDLDKKQESLDRSLKQAAVLHKLLRLGVKSLSDTKKELHQNYAAHYFGISQHLKDTLNYVGSSFFPWGEGGQGHDHGQGEGQGVNSDVDVDQEENEVIVIE